MKNKNTAKEKEEMRSFLRRVGEYARLPGDSRRLLIYRTPGGLSVWFEDHITGQYIDGVWVPGEIVRDCDVTAWRPATRWQQIVDTQASWVVRHDTETERGTLIATVAEADTMPHDKHAVIRRVFRAGGCGKLTVYQDDAGRYVAWIDIDPGYDDFRPPTSHDVTGELTQAQWSRLAARYGRRSSPRRRDGLKAVAAVNNLVLPIHPPLEKGIDVEAWDNL